MTDPKDIHAQVAAAAAGTTAVADAPPPPKTLLDWLRDPTQQRELATALPKQIDPDRFVRVVVTLCKNNPDLMECTRDSLLGAILRAGQLGLEPGPLGLSYLVPFWNNQVYDDAGKKAPRRREVQLQIGYKGYINLARRSREIANIEARTVFTGDEFEFKHGTGHYLSHVPAPPEERGDPGPKRTRDDGAGPAANVRCYYAFVDYVNGGSQFEVLWPQDIDKYRLQSSAPNSPAWLGHYDPMAWKTCIRVMHRWLPLTTEFTEALNDDEGVMSFNGITEHDVIETSATEGTSPEPDDGSCAECGAADGQAHERGCSRG